MKVLAYIVVAVVVFALSVARAALLVWNEKNQKRSKIINHHQNAN